MAEKQGASTQSEEYSKQCVSKLHRGSLLLKQESNGLHLRWLVLDQTNTYIYWLNPKKDVLLIEQENTIPLTRITKVLVSPDAQVLNNQQESEERVRVSALSFSFDVFFDNQRVEIYSPTQSEFETWLIGLSYLIGNDKVIQAEIPPGQKLRSLDDVDFLRTRLAEMMELTDSLLKEAASLMEIRAKRDRTIAFLLRRVKTLLGQSTDDKGQDKQQQQRPASRQDGDKRLAQGGSAESDKNYLERRLIRTEAQVHELEQQLQSRTDASKLSSGPVSQQIVELRQQLRERNEEIAKLNGIIQSYFSTRPRPQSPARNQRTGQAPEVSKTLVPSASNVKGKQTTQQIDKLRVGSRKGQKRGQSREDERDIRNWQSREIGPNEWDTPEAGTYINYPCIYSAEKGDDDEEEQEEEEEDDDEEDEDEEEEEEEGDDEEEEDEDEVEIRRLELDLARLRRQNARRQLEIQLDRLREFRQKHQIPYGTRRSITPRLSESAKAYLKERQGQGVISYNGVPQRQFFRRSRSRTPTPKPTIQDRIQAYKAASNVGQAIKRDGSLPRKKSKSPAPRSGDRKGSQTPVDERPCGLAADVGRQLRVLQQQRDAYYQEQAYRNSWINQKRQIPKEEIDDDDDDDEIEDDNLVVRGRQLYPQPVLVERGRQLYPQPVLVERNRNQGILQRRPINQNFVEEEEEIDLEDEEEDEEEEEEEEEDDDNGQSYTRLTRQEIQALREYYNIDDEDETVPAQLTSRDMRTRSPSYTPYQTPQSQRQWRQRSGSLQDNTKALQGYYSGSERLAQTERVPVRDADKPEWTRVTYSFRDGHNTPTQETRRISYASGAQNGGQNLPQQPRKTSTQFLIPDQYIRRGRGPTPKGTPKRGKRSNSRASVSSITSLGSSVGNSRTPKKSWSRNRSSSKVVSRSRSRSKQGRDNLTQQWPIGRQGALGNAAGTQVYPSGRPPLPPAKAKSNVRAKSPWGEEQRHFYRRT
ncbi:MAG: hypothetical protein EZS28_007971 [Streblomastix strix]|uniref:PH domain-containing protein n=1 Tax=Streblomastix strix TaxID=222440 RepID=A0A5J4WNI0_9EUKA|nr:MAG: hypothetical protein EZS28_007971 [Streblomastix strix]